MIWGRYREVARFTTQHEATELARSLADDGFRVRVQAQRRDRPLVTPLAGMDLAADLHKPSASYVVEVHRSDHEEVMALLGGGEAPTGEQREGRGGGVPSPLLWQVALLVVLLGGLGVWWVTG